VHLASLDLKSGNNGEIRVNCRMLNAGNKWPPKKKPSPESLRISWATLFLAGPQGISATSFLAGP
jgi:hypothetical protein